VVDWSEATAQTDIFERIMTLATHTIALAEDRWPAAADVYVYFNNDPGGAAVVNSATFAVLARDRGLTVTRTPPVGDVPLTTAIPTW